MKLSPLAPLLFMLAGLAGPAGAAELTNVLRTIGKDLHYAIAWPPPGLKTPCVVDSFVLGRRFSVTITQRLLDKSSVWNDAVEPPPLAVGKATKLAEAMREELLKDTKDLKWNLHSVALCQAGERRWYWLITYEGFFLGGISASPPRLQLVVLMDGTVLEPRVSDLEKRGDDR